MIGDGAYLSEGTEMEKRDPIDIALELGMEVIHHIECRTLPSSHLIPYSLAKKHLLLPIEESADGIVIAVADPLDIESLQIVRWRVDKPVKTVVAPKGVLVESIERYYQSRSEHLDEVVTADDEVAKDDELDLLQEDRGGASAQILNQIFREAIRQEASDIHFEPISSGLAVRFRIDGVLHARPFNLNAIESAVLTRIKVLAQMDIAERRLPQDGRIKVRFGGRCIDFRVSSVPISHGERLVLRVLDKGNVVLGINEIGMDPEVLTSFKKIIRRSEGLILVTGPTGSGKTTTLYSAISELDLSQINVMTIEDPVEYKLDKIAQIAVRPQIDLTFARGLRHILRQDPDVIMVGEIRDLETAQIAIQASLTGHLVFSTLHTNDAASAVTRLVDMGIEPYLLSASLIGVLAQRLVRKVCPYCRVEGHPSSTLLDQLGIEESSSIFYRGRGCSECFDSGYKGRHGLYELMMVSPELRHRISCGSDLDQIRFHALKDGLVTLREHGVRLAKKGITSLEEVLRLTRTTDDA